MRALASIENTRDGEWSILQEHTRLNILNGFDNEEVEVVSWVLRAGEVRGAWVTKS